MSHPMHLSTDWQANLLLRPMKETSTKEVAELFRGEAKPEDRWMLGLELELLGHNEESKAPASFAPLSATLDAVGEALDWDGVYERDALVGLQGPGTSISLEPGGQIEFATAPARRIRALRTELMETVGIMSEAARAQGVGLWAIGHHPFATRDDAPFMPKARYDLMRRYMPTRGDRAFDMMHLTASVQCAVDFSSEENMVEKVRAAALISPFIAALTAASPFSAGEVNGYHSVRYEIWRHTDPARCGIWPEMLDAEGLTFDRYVEHALDTPAMFFMRDKKHLDADGLPYRDYVDRGFQGTPVTVADFLDHLTSMFPEVRPKGYVELRGADCLPPAFAVGIATFWRGILDDADTRKAAIDRLNTLDFEAIQALQADVARHGLEATCPVGPVSEVAQWLVEKSHTRLQGSAPDCAECLEPLREMADEKTSLAMRMLQAAERSSIAEAVKQTLVS